MPSRQRVIERASLRARDTIVSIGHELRDARLNRDLTLGQVGRAVALSEAEVSRIERGMRPNISVWNLSRMAAAVGLDLSLKAYPGASPIRDAAHSALLGRLRSELPTDAGWRSEVPFDIRRDQRAWDAVIVLAVIRIGVEAETHPRDLQELSRRLALKERDGGVSRVILLLLDSRANRYALLGPNPLVGPRFLVPGGEALARLRAGQDPGGNAIILL